MAVAESTPGRAVVRIDRFLEPHPLVELRIAGWIERALEIARV